MKERKGKEKRRGTGSGRHFFLPIITYYPYLKRIV